MCAFLRSCVSTTCIACTKSTITEQSVDRILFLFTIANSPASMVLLLKVCKHLSMCGVRACVSTHSYTFVYIDFCRCGFLRITTTVEHTKSISACIFVRSLHQTLLPSGEHFYVWSMVLATFSLQKCFALKALIVANHAPLCH